jgi:hypothetical protein
MARFGGPFAFPGLRMWLKPVTRKGNITQPQADKAVRQYRSMHGIVRRSESKANAKASA